MANGQDYRLLSAAFVHYGLLHLALNMYALYLIGGAFERYVGSMRFLAIYLVSALAGSFGALLVTPHSHTVGASGAIFGLMGALFVLERQRGMALLGGSIGGLILINLLITFGIPGISIGGHVGGLIGGGLVAFALSGYGRGHLAYGRLGVLSAVGVIAVAVGSLVGALAVAGKVPSHALDGGAGRRHAPAACGVRMGGHDAVGLLRLLARRGPSGRRLPARPRR